MMLRMVMVLVLATCASCGATGAQDGGAGGGSVTGGGGGSVTGGGGGSVTGGGGGSVTGGGGGSVTGGGGGSVTGGGSGMTCANCSASMCCDGSCVDTTTSQLHCGGCNSPCVSNAPHRLAVCTQSACQRSCEVGFFDCDGNAANGCEASAACVCTPGAMRSCYSGPWGTNGVGLCHGGQQQCDPNGLGWGTCAGQLVPTTEVCADGLDQDCNGVADDSQDEDGDGFARCGGDCCDRPSDCAHPSLVNPGAWDVPGNAVNDDCVGEIDDGLAPCDGALAGDTSNAMDSARAMGVCQSTTQAGRTWGLVAADYALASGSGTPAPNAHAIRTHFGANGVQEGATFLVLSTGPAASRGDATADPAQSTNYGLSSAAPADWLSLNASHVPVPGGCPTLSSEGTAFDPVELKLDVRVPTNAHAFSFDINFFTSDYAEGVCSPYVDQFLVLLDSNYQPQGGSPANPPDKNLAIISGSTGRRTINANLAAFDFGGLSACVNGPTGCGGGVVGDYHLCSSASGLAGTGFDDLASGACTMTALRGAATGWRTISGNVVPGERAQLRIVIWDTGDGALDSTVLLDNFRWSTSNLLP